MSVPKVERVVRWEDGVVHVNTDELAEEEPLEIRVRGRAVSVTMRTPGEDEPLAAGFLLTEGIIHKREDVSKIESCQRNEFGNVINIQLAPEVTVDFDRLTHHVFASTSCGLCGKASIDSIQNRFPPLAETSIPVIEARLIANMPEQMRQAQAMFERTGGLHAAGLFDLDGKILTLHEDVGRHNAVDKVLGRALLEGWLPLARHLLCVSGRVSFEIMQKALAARVPIIAAVSAPTNLAVDFARESGQTLVGFVRGKRMNIYTCPDRVVS
jgi:FdhD protein